MSYKNRYEGQPRKLDRTNYLLCRGFGPVWTLRFSCSYMVPACLEDLGICGCWFADEDCKAGENLPLFFCGWNKSDPDASMHKLEIITNKTHMNATLCFVSPIILHFPRESGIGNRDLFSFFCTRTLPAPRSFAFIFLLGNSHARQKCVCHGSQTVYRRGYTNFH